jgi:hypothetical protein
MCGAVPGVPTCIHIESADHGDLRVEGALGRCSLVEHLERESAMVETHDPLQTEA